MRALIEARPGEVRTAVLDSDDRLVDLLVERDDRPSVAGNRYLGRVSTYDRSLQAAFVDIGLARPGLLPRKAAGGQVLNEGAAVVVEVVREPGRGKGAKLAARTPAPGEPEGRPPCLLWTAAPRLELLRRHAPERVVVDGADAFADLRRQAPELAPALQAHRAPGPLFAAEGLEGEIAALLEPDVPLPGGGALRIEPVQTLTAVDVDSGGRGSAGGAGRLALETDLAAVPELGRQLRLRALTGLIVVDFLELDRKAEREQVTNALKATLAADPIGGDVSPMRASGLVEIARPRLRRPLHELLTEPCGLGGSGRVPDAASLAFELLRTVEREAAARPGRSLRAVVAPEVAAALDGPAAAAREALAARQGRALPLRVEPGRPRDTWEIEAVDT